MHIYDSWIFHPSTMLVCGPSESGNNCLQYMNVRGNVISLNNSIERYFIFINFIYLCRKNYFYTYHLEYADSIFRPVGSGFTILIYETWKSCYDVMLAKNLINLSIKGLDNMDNLKDEFH